MRIALALLLLPLIAFAQPVTETTIEWLPPTAFESGDPLDPQTDLESYRLYCWRPGNEPDSYYVVPVTEDNTHTASRADVFGTPGSFHCHMTAVTHDGLESVPSNEVFLRWLGRPGPVQILILE